MDIFFKMFINCFHSFCSNMQTNSDFFPRFFFFNQSMRLQEIFASLLYQELFSTDYTISSCAYLYGNGFFQVVALNNLFFLIMINDIVKAATEKKKEQTNIEWKTN